MKLRKRKEKREKRKEKREKRKEIKEKVDIRAIAGARPAQ